MERNRKIYTELVIVGNGFDLQHEYRTSYKDFIDYIGDSFFRDFNDYVEIYCGDSYDWHQFEKQVEALAAAFYSTEMQTYLEEKVLRDFNVVFRKIQQELIEYLKKTTSENSSIELQSVRSHFDENTLCLNFNYTPTAEKYLNGADIIYVHGSLNEQDIVLGHDPTNSFCLASYENMMWFKEYCRERLAFSRYIKWRFNISTSDLLYQELVNDFILIRNTSEHKGNFDEEDQLNLGHPELFKEYISKFKSMDEIGSKQISFDDVRNICVIGHSLKSDEYYLRAC